MPQMDTKWEPPMFFKLPYPPSGPQPDTLEIQAYDNSAVAVLVSPLYFMCVYIYISLSLSLSLSIQYTYYIMCHRLHIIHYGHKMRYKYGCC